MVEKEKSGLHMTNRPPLYRLFFALWPPAEVQGLLYRRAVMLSRQFGGRPTRCENLHVTLHFIGPVERERVADFKAAAEKIESSSFHLQLERLTLRRRQKMLWAMPEQPPEALLTLQGELGRVLAERCAFVPEKRAYQPHVTMLRKLTVFAEPPAWQQLAWQVRDFCLVESRQAADGVHYRVLQRWSLRRI